MDELVLQAMQRWPGVPAVYGWLRLDRRGRWMLVDRGMPGFDETRHGAGSVITSPPIVDFIGRNYLHDAQGRWYWQNGPQQVFVDLELAPLILRVLGNGESAGLVAHTGEAVGRVDAAWRTPGGELILETDLGPGAIHDLDLAALDLAEDSPPAPGGTGLSLTILGRTLLLHAWEEGRAPRFERRPRPPARA